VIKTNHWNETLVMCREIHGLDTVKVEIVNNFIYRAQAGELSGCHCCGVQLQTLFIIPCGHLVCTECIDNRTTECPVCCTQFDVDDFQRLQPGLDLQYSLNLNDEAEKRKQQQLFDSQTSVPARSASINENHANILREAREGADPPMQARSHKKGESCIYSSSSKDGKCNICREEHFDCDFMNSQQQCSICFKLAEECPVYASKASYVISKLLHLRENPDNQKLNISSTAARVFAKTNERRRLKVIVYSEFREIYVRPLSMMTCISLLLTISDTIFSSGILWRSSYSKIWCKCSDKGGS
jgi:hypothetical protein